MLSATCLGAEDLESLRPPKSDGQGRERYACQGGGRFFLCLGSTSLTAGPLSPCGTVLLHQERCICPGAIGEPFRRAHGRPATATIRVSKALIHPSSVHAGAWMKRGRPAFGRHAVSGHLWRCLGAFQRPLNLCTLPEAGASIAFSRRSLEPC